MNKNIVIITKNLIFTTAFFFAGIAILQAAGTWTAPTQNPPGGNVDAPLNTGNNQQFKLGQLNVNTDTTSPYSVGFTTWGKSIFNGPVQIIDGNQGVDKVLTSDANGNATWKVLPSTNSGVGSNPVVMVVQRFTTKYSTVMAHESFREWLFTSPHPSMPTDGGDDHGWYVRDSGARYLDTKDQLCKFFVKNGKAYGSVNTADYGSDNGNVAYYWDTTTATWKEQGHGDNGAIDITSIICVGEGIYERALPFLL